MTQVTTTMMNEPSHTWPGSLRSIGLDELNSLASLQTRVDRKYLIRTADLDAIIAQVAPAVRVLDIDGDRQFGYWSTYFDTAELTSYHDAARRRPRRWKVRIRSYLDSDLHFVEVKTRNRRGNTVKNRQFATSADHGQLSESSRRFVADTIARELGLGLADGEQIVARLQPTLSTEYERVTLLLGDDLARATIDAKLMVAQPGGAERRLPDHVIVETKTSDRPSLLDRELWNRGIRPVKISKFGTGLALLQPSLPAAKWNRLLRNEFDWVRTPAV